MATAWAAEAARSIAEQPIFLTWNFFLTAIGLPALGWFLARLIKTRDELNEQNLALWQEGAKERNKAVTEKLERIEKCIASIKGDLKEKVDNGHCHERHEAVKSDINDLKAKIWA